MSPVPPPPPILIAGPTASGKSALAVELARALGGVVVNADSMQVYAELTILTARPTPAETALAPHALYGHVPAAQAYSTGRWLADIAEALTEARAAQRRPIIVGGTGLYFKALLEGLAPVPAIPEPVRAKWREAAARRGPADLHSELERRDAIMAARLRPTDPQRIVRALEVLDATGRSLADWQAEPAVPLLRPEETVRLVLAPDRAWLKERCARRFDAMLSAGALAEVEAFRALHLDRSLPARGALGVAPLAEHLAGRLSLAAATAEAVRQTEAYIKRQLTWLRSQMGDWQSVAPEASPAVLAALVAVQGK